ncbi:MAG TPA: hypothetical protein EYP80_03015 [Candidatus Aenigmarchaeota archaeon]|nr:hypothetical protein [Candidatus Aenigmarchaeota archaeon]
MKLPFQHKEEGITIPIDEVKKLREQGKSDREIIIELKNKGYSFQAIEKAMLQSLKESATSELMLEKEPSFEQTQATRKELPTKESLVEKPKFALPPPEQLPLEAPFEPTDLIEEVVEGVVEEKFEKLDTKFEYVHNEQDKLKKANEELRNFFVGEFEKIKQNIRDLRDEIEKLRDEFEDLIIKVNALEKAFKQFLPDIFAKIRERNLEERGISILDEEENKGN